MPIHLNVLNPRQAEAGKIKIGGLGAERNKRSGEGTYQLPVKYDHFVLRTTERDESGNFELDEKLMEQLTKDDDGKIRQIPILFSSDDIDEIFPHTLACYWGQNLHCRGDGQTATRYEIKKEHRDGRDVTIKTGASEQRSCPCDYLGAEKGMQCRPHATLWCTIVAGDETQIGARHSFRTTSWDSIRSILAGLDEIQRMVGTLVGPPLSLQVRPRKVKPKGQATSKIVYVVHVICRSRDIQELRQRVLAQAEMRHNVAALAGRPLRLGLPKPADASETAEEQAKIRQEWHPEPPADDIDYDPVTGEVYDTDAVDSPSPEPGSQEEPPRESLDPDAELPNDHRIRNRLKGLLTELAKMRDFSDNDLQKGRAEIWTEITEAVELPGLSWKQLTTTRAVRIDEKLIELLKAAEPQP